MRSASYDIVLTTFNAKYAHAAFGLRYLLANLGPLRGRAAILEFDISQRPTDVLEVILAADPKVVGVGVYIWNAAQSAQLVADLKRVRPDVTVVLGGPEVSYETDQQEVVRDADYVITGEADLAFAGLCRQLLSGRRPLMKILPADLPEFRGEGSGFGVQGRGKGSGFRVQGSGGRGRDLQTGARDVAVGAVGAQDSDSTDPVPYSLNPEPRTLNPPPPRTLNPPPSLSLPYDLYTDEDIAHRVVYVEASRGCPFKCEFCLSSLDVPVRNAPPGEFLAAMQRLLDRGLNRFKFVDRTFNLNLNISRAILKFFHERYRPGLFLHFEMIPDRLPEALREPIRAFPPGALQFEVGIQSFNDEVCKRISRRQDVARVEDNLRFLRRETGVHVHADLIVGLPGEDLASFGRGFDRLVGLGPQEIQVGILKRLRGTPIVRHDGPWGMVYSPHAPYEVLRTKDVEFADMQRMRRFARCWDLVANSGNFVETAPLIWAGRAPFEGFLRFTDWLFGRVGRNHSIALLTLAELLFRYLTEQAGHDPREAARSLWRDYRRGGRRDGPDFLRPYMPEEELRASRRSLPAAQSVPPRQARHLDSAHPPPRV